MDRHLLDDMFSKKPQRAFDRALAEVSTCSDCYAFLLDKTKDGGLARADREPEIILKVLVTRLPDKVVRHDEPFVARLAEIFAGETWDRHASDLLEAFDAAKRIDRPAWLDLTKRLRGRLPNWVWFRFVDEVRGCAIFNTLNAGRPSKYAHLSRTTDQLLRGFCENDEKDRPEPLIVPLLDNPDAELAARAYALSLPLHVILYLHDRLPVVITLDEVKSVIEGKVEGHEPWRPPFPEWVVPFAARRLHFCEEEEAHVLFDWLLTMPHDPEAMLEAAVARFKKSLLEPKWHAFVGAALNTGRAWKDGSLGGREKKGNPTRERKGKLVRGIVEFCVETNKGFPAALLEEARVHAKDDASRDAIVSGLHDVTASVLVEYAERAIRAGDWEKAKRILAALHCLDPGSFISGPVQHLQKIAELPPEIARDVELCARIFKRPGGRAPTPEGHRDAFIELCGEGR